MISIISTVLLSAFLVCAAVLDLHTRRIPNVLTVSGFMLALTLRSTLGSGAVLDGLQGAGLALVVVLPLFLLGALGGGDLKLLVAVGAFMQPAQFVLALLATAVVGGVLAVGESIRRGAFNSLLFNTAGLASHVISRGRVGHRSTINTPGAVSVPYALAIAVGSLAVWFLWPMAWV